MIKAENLVKVFGGTFRAVDGMTFEVEPGEIYGLLGPNGAGKTTTTRMLSGLLRPTSGTATVAGHSVLGEAHAIRSKIGILTEVPGLYERLTPLEYLDFFAQVHELRGAARRARVEESLHLVGMWDRRNVVIRGFSKGMQQRIAIARTLLHDPEVLFFDEPTAALDPEAARNVRDHLLELVGSRRRSVLLCTHNLPEAEKMCRRLSVVQHGRQVAEGTPAQLKARVERGISLRVRPASPGLLAAVEQIPGVAQAHLVAANAQTSAAEPDTLVFRTTQPERVNPEVVRTAVNLGADVLGLSEEEVSLEDVYLALIRGSGVDGGVRRASASRLDPGWGDADTALERASA